MKSRKTPYYTPLGDKVVAEFVETAVSNTDSTYNTSLSWQILETHERDWDRNEFGREYQLKTVNQNNQGSLLSPMTFESLVKLRDALSEIIQNRENQ